MSKPNRSSGRIRNYRAAGKAKMLSPEWREKFKTKATKIRLLLGSESKSRVEIGHILIEIKDSLHGELWLEWIKEELKLISVATAENYMRIARFCDERGIVKFTNLPLSALVDLSRKHVTPEQVETALAEVEKGPVSHKRMKQILKRIPEPEPEPEHKPTPTPIPIPSNRPVLTVDEIGDLRDLVLQHLKGNPDLYDKVMDAAKERGLRLQIIGKSGPLDILEVDDPLTPYDPDQPHWGQDVPPPPPPHVPPLPSPQYMGR